MSDTDVAVVVHSIFSSIDALIYRCRNDDDHTMETVIGQARVLTGYEAADIVENTLVSWAALIHPEDADRVTAAVNAAVASKSSWDVDYRIQLRGGGVQPVRERGCAVFEGGELKYLQGLVVRADAELALRDEMSTSAQSAESEKRQIFDTAQMIVDSIHSLSILAVNARIEAARSGASGLGFAIVADEIGKLAEENGALARRITEQIGSDRRASQ